MKRNDFFTMLYQFVFGGLAFFIIISNDFTNFLTGRIINPFEFMGISTGFNIGELLSYFLIPLIFLSLSIQRKIYVNQQIKKSIKTHKK